MQQNETKINETIVTGRKFSKLADIINKFLNDYDTNEEYKKFVQSGTSSSENVKDGLNW